MFAIGPLHSNALSRRILVGARRAEVATRDALLLKSHANITKLHCMDLILGLLVEGLLSFLNQSSICGSSSSSSLRLLLRLQSLCWLMLVITIDGIIVNR